MSTQHPRLTSAFLPAAPITRSNTTTSFRAPQSISISTSPFVQGPPLPTRNPIPTTPSLSPKPMSPSATAADTPPTSASPITNPSTPSAATTPTPATPAQSDTVIRLFRRHSDLPPDARRAVVAHLPPKVTIHYETCFNIALKAPLTPQMEKSLHWLLAETFDPSGLSPRTTLPPSSPTAVSATLEVGPRLNFQTAWSSNAVTICHACGIPVITRLERSRRYALQSSPVTSQPIPPSAVDAFSAAVHDRMTETVYASPLTTFYSNFSPPPSRTIDVLSRGREALVEASEQEGLGFDEQDVEYYHNLFANTMKRNPTNVELFDLAQSNSEHSRHWFFKGRLVIDGIPSPTHLLDVVRQTLTANPANSVIAFADNSSTIRGANVPVLAPSLPGCVAPLRVVEADRDVLFTAETHNFPSGVAPFPGAETGTGGRIRDTAATGIGSLVCAGTAGYSVGNLRMEGHDLPWEDATFRYPSNLASPLDILIGASNGASDYGNKFGEPVINGFARSYGLRLPSGERREYVKPIMFSGGMGQMEHSHARKGEAEIGLLVVKVGGPAYRIGMGGGAASSMMQGDNKADLDFNAVQRGDAEMAQKVYRVLRACVEMGKMNPIVSIHDQGAGGNCNVVKELIYPAGAKIDLRKVWVGDASLSALEIWGAEYQEQFGLLLRPEHEELFRTLCERENVVAVVLGSIDGSGRIVLWDEEEGKSVVDMDLEAVLGDLPQKTFTDERIPFQGAPLRLPDDATVESVLQRVLSLMTVGSKRFLTTKVDRSVTGLVAQQQCVGPLQLPLADFAVTAQSHFALRGSVTAIGERPCLTSLNAGAMARMTVGEMMTNMAGALVTSRGDIKCEGNWMWAAKLKGDCASLHDAAIAMRDVMVGLGVAVDGGKDSLSMAARCPLEGGEVEMVRAPGTLVVSGYCTMEDVRCKLTPDLKGGKGSVLIHVDIAGGKRRLGGGAVAQVFGQVGEECPDVDDVTALREAFDMMQKIIGREDVLSYHDVSDGGLLTTVLEMAFAGNCGVDVMVDSVGLGVDRIACLFAEELGMVIEVVEGGVEEVCALFEGVGVGCGVVGRTRGDMEVGVMDGEVCVLKGDVRDLRDGWEATSFALELRQADAACVEEERRGLRKLRGPTYHVPWTPRGPVGVRGEGGGRARVGIVREEGSNGDREMAAAFHMAGFEVWDVCMRDIAGGRVSLAGFDGVAFVGGFSFGDVLDSAKGWAGVVRLNERVRREFDDFFARADTFSLGVCNGCQLMALLGVVPYGGGELGGVEQPRFVHNRSGRYESRFCTVRVEEGNEAVMLRGMGGGILGVWVAHGEGRAYFADEGVLGRVMEDGLAVVRYVGEDGRVTQEYPHNPNGSVEGVAAICSRDGRHLAMMPHPERGVLPWQWGYWPRGMERLSASPWLTMFHNAYEWVVRGKMEGGR